MISVDGWIIYVIKFLDTNVYEACGKMTGIGLYKFSDLIHELVESITLRMHIWKQNPYTQQVHENQTEFLAASEYNFAT
jgi:hypothetical protein